MASRLTKDGIKLSQSSSLVATSTSTIVPLNLDEGIYWNFNGSFAVSSNAASTPTAEDLRASAAWDTGVSSNLVVTFNYLQSGSISTTTTTLQIGGLEILANNGADGLSTVKDVKLEVSHDAVNYTTVVDNLELPSTSSSKPAYILLPTESFDTIGHPQKTTGAGFLGSGYNHFRLTIKNGYSTDNIKISKILLRPSSLKRTLTEASNRIAVFTKNTNVISSGQISTVDINMGSTTQSLDDFHSGLQIDIAANTSAISGLGTQKLVLFNAPVILDLTAFDALPTAVNSSGANSSWKRLSYSALSNVTIPDGSALYVRLLGLRGSVYQAVSYMYLHTDDVANSADDTLDFHSHAWYYEYDAGATSGGGNFSGSASSVTEGYFIPDEGISPTTNSVLLSRGDFQSMSLKVLGYIKIQ